MEWRTARGYGSPEFTRLNFEVSEYTDATGRSLPVYRITRDGFVFLARGFTGQGRTPHLSQISGGDAGI
jgi:Rha family phage regulatory protein